MKFIERYPNYCDFGKPQEYEINSIDELYKVHRVHTAVEWEDFYRLSIDRPNNEGRSPWFVEDRSVLMAETKDGYEWWGIGWLIHPLDDWTKELPNWEAKYKDKENHG